MHCLWATVLYQEDIPGDDGFVFLVLVVHEELAERPALGIADAAVGVVLLLGVLQERGDRHVFLAADRELHHEQAHVVHPPQFGGHAAALHLLRPRRVEVVAHAFVEPGRQRRRRDDHPVKVLVPALVGGGAEDVHLVLRPHLAEEARVHQILFVLVAEPLVGVLVVHPPAGVVADHLVLHGAVVGPGTGTRPVAQELRPVPEELDGLSLGERLLRVEALVVDLEHGLHVFAEALGLLPPRLGLDLVVPGGVHHEALGIVLLGAPEAGLEGPPATLGIKVGGER